MSTSASAIEELRRIREQQKKEAEQQKIIDDAAKAEKERKAAFLNKASIFQQTKSKSDDEVKAEISKLSEKRRFAKRLTNQLGSGSSKSNQTKMRKPDGGDSDWEFVDQGKLAPSYYWNRVSNEVSYDVPLELQSNFDEIVDEAVNCAWVEVDPGDGQAKYYWNSISNASAYELPKGAQLASSQIDNDASQWIPGIDPSSGKEYYYNSVTGHTQWDRPACLLVALVSDKSPDEIRENWVTRIDESSGHPYYVNLVTHKTQWDQPNCLSEIASEKNIETCSSDNFKQTDQSVDESIKVAVEENVEMIQTTASINEPSISASSSRQPPPPPPRPDSTNSEQSHEVSRAQIKAKVVRRVSMSVHAVPLLGIAPPSVAPKVPPPPPRPKSMQPIDQSVEHVEKSNESGQNAECIESITVPVENNEIRLELLETPPALDSIEQNNNNNTSISGDIEKSINAIAEDDEDSSDDEANEFIDVSDISERPSEYISASSGMIPTKAVDSTLTTVPEDEVANISSNTMNTSESNVSSLREDMTIEQIVGVVGSASLTIYAEKFFIHDRRGLLFSSKSTTEKMLKWKNELIKMPLRKLSSPDLHKIALQLFRNITGFMGDRRSSKVKEDHAEKLLGFAVSSGPELHDEIYCQLCKQLIGNPTPASNAKGWELMVLFLSVFPPSDDLVYPLLSFFAGNLKSRNPVIQKYAEFCIRSCIKRHRLGIKNEEEIPSQSEMSTIWTL